MQLDMGLDVQRKGLAVGQAAAHIALPSVAESAAESTAEVVAAPTDEVVADAASASAAAATCSSPCPSSPLGVADQESLHVLETLVATDGGNDSALEFAFRGSTYRVLDHVAFRSAAEAGAAAAASAAVDQRHVSPSRKVRRRRRSLGEVRRAQKNAWAGRDQDEADIIASYRPAMRFSATIPTAPSTMPATMSQSASLSAIVRLDRQEESKSLPAAVRAWRAAKELV